MPTFKILRRNDEFFLRRFNEQFYVHSTGEPEAQFAPLAIRNRSFLSTIDALTSYGGWYRDDFQPPTCLANFDKIYYDFRWQDHDPTDPELGKYNSDLYAIFRETEFSGTMGDAGQFKEGFNGQYRMLYDPEFDTGDYIKCEPFRVDSIIGTGNDLVAKTTYASGSSFYNAWKIDEIEFGSGHFPRLKFSTEQDAQNFADSYVGGGTMLYGLINAINIPGVGEPEPSWAYAPENYSVEDPLVGIDHYVGFTNHSGLYVWNEHLIKVSDTSNEYIARESGLLAFIENNGTNTNHIYINMKMEDGLVEPVCFNSDHANPQITRRRYLEERLSQNYTEYRTYGPLHDCGYVTHGFLIKGINKYGQGPFLHEDDNNDIYLSTLGIGYSIPGIDYPMGLTEFELDYFPVSPPTSNPWLDPDTGNVWTLLWVTGEVRTLGQGVTYLTTWNAPGKLAGSRPNNWYYIDSVEEGWRVSGPSGESVERFQVQNCGPGEYRAP